MTPEKIQALAEQAVPIDNDMYRGMPIMNARYMDNIRVERDRWIAGYTACEKEREWISVNRVSPPELVDLLVYIPDEEHIAAAIYERSEGFYENYDNKPIGNPVSHWMLMPVKPPKIQP